MNTRHITHFNCRCRICYIGPPAKWAVMFGLMSIVQTVSFCNTPHIINRHDALMAVFHFHKNF